MRTKSQLQTTSPIHPQRHVYFHFFSFTANSVGLCFENGLSGKTANVTVFLKKGRPCHKEWPSVKNGQFVTEHHRCPVSSLDVLRRMLLKKGILLHHCVYMLQKSCGYTLFMPVGIISSMCLTVTSYWLKYYEITTVTPHENHSLF